MYNEKRMLLRVLFAVLISFISVAFEGVSYGSSLKPKKVAVISSSGVDGDFRHWRDYDNILKGLGWEFEKFRNTEIDKFFARADEFDLLLTTALWNYGDPVDLKKYVPKIREYIAKGNIAIFVDMCYPVMTAWLSELDPDLAVVSSGTGSSKDYALIDENSLGLCLYLPLNGQGVENICRVSYWAHFTSYGKKYDVWLKTKGGTAIGLWTVLDKGAMVVTTGYIYTSGFLKNLYLNTLALKNGVKVILKDIPSQLPAATNLKGKVLFKNTLDMPIDLTVLLELEDCLTKKILYKDNPQQITIAAGDVALVGLDFPYVGDGSFFLKINFKTSGMDDFLTVYHNFRTIPIAEVDINRYIFLLSDTLKLTVSSESGGGALDVRVLAVDKSSNKTIMEKAFLVEKPKEVISFPVKELFSPGDYLLKVDIKKGEKKKEVSFDFRVVDKERPDTVSYIDENGVLYVNDEVFFPLGIYHVGKDELSRIKQLGFNCVTSPIYRKDQTELTEKQILWHEEARKNGLFVLSELSSYPRAKDRVYFVNAKKIISQLRLMPEVFVQYTVDEPLLGRISYDLIKDFCQLTKEVDPDHANFIVGVPSKVEALCGITDIVATDYYPIFLKVPETLKPIENITEKLVSKSRSVWQVIQTHRLPPPSPKRRYPTIEEIRCMSYLALNGGAKGLLYYAWGGSYFSDNTWWRSGIRYNESLQKQFPKLLSELKKIGRWYLLGKKKRIEHDSLSVVVLELSGAKKVILVNPTSQEVEAKISLPEKSIERKFLPFEVLVEDIK